MQVVINGLMTNYERAGTGASIVLLHGWGDSSATFKSLAAELKQHFEVVSFDLPGFGGTEAPKAAWGLTQYAEFVAAAMHKLGVRPSAIIGHSNGGAIAIRGIALGLFSAEKLVLLASAGVRDQYNPRKKALRLAAKVAKAATSPLPGRLRQKLKKSAYRKIGSDLFVAEHMQETFKRIITDDVLDDAPRVRSQTLLIYGSLDDSTPVRYGELFEKRIPASRLEVVQGAGHFVHIDNPSEVRRLIVSFLEGLS
jgi:pimeloyl-ACP methyl ester carboxylesterase